MIVRSIGVRLFASFGLMIVIVAAIGAYGFESLRGVAEVVTAQLAASYESATDASDLREIARQVSLTLGTAGASATSADLPRIRQMRSAFHTQLAGLESRNGRTPATAEAGRLFDEMADTGVAYVEAAVQQRWIDSGKLSVKFQSASARLEEILSAERAVERHKIDQLLTALGRDISALSVRFAFTVGLCLVTGLLLALTLQRSLVRPLRVLTTVTRRIAVGGDLTQTIDISRDDELGELATAFGALVQKLREIPVSLRASVDLLNQAVAEVGTSTGEQNDTLTKQAAALQQMQVTAQEIKQTSAVASQKAAAVLEVVNRAAEIGRSGEVAVAQSLAGLGEIRTSTAEINAQIAMLGERTAKIAGITDTVKGISNQSNMLALNATIEAVRSGEHGRGFAIVAREIRSLADQSVHSTRLVGEILAEITGTIDRAVSMTASGERRSEAGIRQITASGDHMSQLSAIVKESAGAVRQIAAAVSQQNAGITQMVVAVSDMSSMMSSTLGRLEEVTRATTVLKDATHRVSQVVDSFQV